MKSLVVAILAVVLLLTFVGAAHAEIAEAAPAVPEHGSVWFGRGLVAIASMGDAPLHGSVWFGSGLQRYVAQSTPVNTFDQAMIRRGEAVRSAPVVSANVPAPPNSFDMAMLLRGPTPDTVEASANSFDAAMLKRGPLRGWLAQRGIAQVVH